MITVTSKSNNGQIDTLYTGANMTDARNAMKAEVASIEAQNAKYATPMSVEYVNGSITGAIVTWVNVVTTIVINDSEQMNSGENMNGDDTKGDTQQSLTSDSTVDAPAIVVSVSNRTGLTVFLDNDGMFTSSRDSALRMTELRARQLIRAKRSEMRRAGRENSLWFDAEVAVY